MTSAASDPAVPGATGAYPQPNQVAIRNAPERIYLLFAFAFALQVLGLHRRRYDIFFAGPVSEIDNLAAFATEGKKRVAWGHFFFTDRALHRIAKIGKAFAAAIGKAPSEATSNAPIKS